MKRTAGLLVLMVLLLTVVALDRGSQVAAQGADAGTPPEQLGRTVFQRSCAVCHGLEGEGRIGPPLDGNLNLDRSDYVIAIILRGRDGMPAFHERLSEAEIAAVAEYIRGAWGNDFAAERSEVTEEGESDQDVDAEPADLLVAQWWHGAEDGAELYEQICARCHGEDGGGGFGPPLLRNDNLGNAQYLVGKILHGQGGMPAFEGLLTREQVALVANYVRNTFGNELEAVDVDLVDSLQSTPVVPGALRISVFPGDSRLSVAGPDRFVRFFSRGSLRGGPVRLDDLLPGIYTVTSTSEDFGAAVAVVEVLSLHQTALTMNLRAVSAEEGPATVRTQVTSASVAAPSVDAGGIHYRRSCAVCHGPEGGGGIGPPLASSATLQDAQFVLDRILNGTSVMPSFANRLTPQQIAAIASFERSSWGNAFGPISIDQVIAQQGGEDIPQVLAPDIFAAGSEIYEEYCAACHGGLGFGAVGPALQGNVALADLPYTVSRIVMGGGGMPSFHGILSTAEMAEIASFIRQAWGNEFGPVGEFRAQNYHGGTSSLGQ